MYFLNVHQNYIFYMGLVNIRYSITKWERGLIVEHFQLIYITTFLIKTFFSYFHYSLLNIHLYVILISYLNFAIDK